MHELGITQGILDRAREAAEEHGAVRVTKLLLVTTPAADFTEDAIRMYFAMLTSDDDLFRDADLSFETRSAEARCLECGSTFAAEERAARCPSCSSPCVRIDPHAPMLQLTDIVIDEGQGEGSGGA